MSTSNFIMAIDAIVAYNRATAAIGELMQRAATEDRDITDDELRLIVDKNKMLEDEWLRRVRDT